MALLRPDAYIGRVEEIAAADLAACGVEAVVLDLDNTLLPRGEDEVPPSACAWVKSLLDAGIRAYVVSNSKKERVGVLSRQLGVGHVDNALKPFTKGLREACSIMEVDPSRTLLVGDQSYTDILGAHFAGMRAVMVVPLTKLDPPHTRVLRLVDKLAVVGMDPAMANEQLKRLYSSYKR